MSGSSRSSCRIAQGSSNNVNMDPPRLHEFLQAAVLSGQQDRGQHEIPLFQLVRNPIHTRQELCRAIDEALAIVGDLDGLDLESL